MAGDKVSTASKPKLRGLLNASIRTNLIGSIVLAGISAVAMQVFIGNARKQRYADYYKTYDPEAHFERLRKAGLMQSAGP